MSDIELVVTGSVLLVVWLSQAVPAFVYIRRMTGAPQLPEAEPASWPRIDVIVPVRDGREDFAQAMQHLLSLDYTNYQVHVVIDHPSDPACEQLSSIPKQDGIHWDYEFLVDPPRDRSLICSSFVQAFEQLSDETDLIAFCGADMNLPKNFLRNMARPMMDTSVGTTLGNRWYIPHKHSWGSLVRYLWNLGAVVPMWLFQIPWGGATALRPSDVRRSGLLDVWKTGMVEDAPIYDSMKKLNLRLAFVPELIVVTDDTISYKQCLNFLHRQLLWTRLYHANWLYVVLAAATATLALLWPWCAGLVSVIARGSDNAVPLFALGFFYWMGLLALALAVDRAVNHVIRANASPRRYLTIGLLVQIALAIPFTQLTYAFVVFRAMFSRRVTWSGIAYNIKSSREITMEHYEPVH